jgi:hypothetical protein
MHAQPAHFRVTCDVYVCNWLLQVHFNFCVVSMTFQFRLRLLQVHFSFCVVSMTFQFRLINGDRFTAIK